MLGSGSILQAPTAHDTYYREEEGTPMDQGLCPYKQQVIPHVSELLHPLPKTELLMYTVVDATSCLPDALPLFLISQRVEIWLGT